MYDITQLTFLTSPIAFAMTYLLHSTAWILLMFCLVKLPAFSTPLIKNYLWKGALIGGLLTSLLIHFSGNSLLEIQLANKNSSFVNPIQQPAADEPLIQVVEEDLIAANTGNQEQVIIDVIPEENIVEPPLVKESVIPVSIEKETQKTSLKLLPFMLLLGCLLWVIGTLFFTTKETIRHVVFIKKIGKRTRINHPTFQDLLKQIRLKLGQRLTIDLSHSPILESPILIKNQEICLPEKALSKLNSDQIEAMLAPRKGHLDFVKLMVENGAKVNKVVHGDGTALINAVRGGHYEVAEYLLEHGADPMLNVPGDENPIAHAVNQGDEMLDLVLKYRKGK